MRTHSALVLDVRELLEHPGSQRELEFDAPVEDLQAGLSKVSGDVHFKLVLGAIDGGLLARGEMSGGYTSECRRCAKPVERPFAFEGAELYRPSTDVWEEGYLIKDFLIDLEPMVRDNVALSLPQSPLCREDCAGLCSRCGTDLNDGPCGCAPAVEGDLRWAALKEIGRDLKG